MKVARIIVLTIALGSGFAAFIVARSMIDDREAAPVPMAALPEPKMDTVDVLVFNRDMPMGSKLTAADMSWQPWPKTGAVETMVTKTARPEAMNELSGSIARQAMMANEPVREARLTKSDRGFMSVILSPGMRALAVEVKAVSTAGGFVLPNDHVDIILTRAAPKGGASGDPYVSETILTNIRVLAIDQQVVEKGEPSVVARDTATLELTPRQAELVAQSQQLGTISLVLRSIRDAEAPVDDKSKLDEANGAVRVVRYGVTSRVTAR